MGLVRTSGILWTEERTKCAMYRPRQSPKSTPERSPTQKMGRTEVPQWNGQARPTEASLSTETPASTFSTHIDLEWKNVAPAFMDRDHMHYMYVCTKKERYDQATSAALGRPWLAAAEISVVKVTTLGSTRPSKALDIQNISLPQSFQKETSEKKT